MIQQLPLPVRLRDSATFDNFYPAGNEQVLHALQDEGEQYLYLWGEPGCGKSHLLQAACHAAGQGTVYLSLAEAGISPAMLEGLPSLSLVCLDDIDVVVGESTWETALFCLFNELRDQGHRLLIAASVSPAALAVRLPDLKSRLSWGSSFKLQTLSEQDKVRAMQHRAHRRGMELPTEVAEFLLKRYPRDMATLFVLVERLDEGSLVAKRRLTIPFVKQWLHL